MRLSRPQTLRRREIAWQQSYLVLVLLSLGGCAWVSGEAVRRDHLAGRSRGRYIDEVPFIPQADNCCGPASLAMVRQYWGEPVEQEQIRAELYLPSAKAFAEGAEFLVSITNDAWFGRTTAPDQYLAMATVRAVENQAYVVRAANTGISTIIAPDGRIVQASGLFTREVVTRTIAPRGRTTFNTRYGDVFARAALGASLLGLLAVGLARGLSAMPVGSRAPVAEEVS
jgi:hypothetical protein